METEIEKLIPHRFPFVFVDKIISANEKEIIGIKSFDHSNEIATDSFPDYNFISGMILVESMAQCGGAGVKKAGLAEGLFGLASIDNVTFFKGVTYNEEIKYVIKNLRVSNRLIKQSGMAYAKNEPVFEATWLCARIDK